MVCKKYYVSTGFDLALVHLRVPALAPHFNPYFALRLAWESQSECWTDECIKQALTQPFREITPADVSDLEPQISGSLYSLHAQCFRHRMSLVSFVPEVIHDPSCGQQGQCSRNWKSAFSSAMMFFVSTRKHFSGREVYQKLSAIEIPNLRDLCRALTFSDIETRGVLWREEQFIRTAEKEIKTHIMTYRPASPRPKPRYIHDPNSVDTPMASV